MQSTVHGTLREHGSGKPGPQNVVRVLLFRRTSACKELREVEGAIGRPRSTNSTKLEGAAQIPQILTKILRSGRLFSCPGDLIQPSTAAPATSAMPLFNAWLQSRAKKPLSLLPDSLQLNDRAQDMHGSAGRLHHDLRRL